MRLSQGKSLLLCWLIVMMFLIAGVIRGDFLTQHGFSSQIWTLVIHVMKQIGLLIESDRLLELIVHDSSHIVLCVKTHTAQFLSHLSGTLAVQEQVLKGLILVAVVHIIGHLFVGT